MTKPYSYQKWHTSRTWPGGGWGEAMAQVRRDQRLSQRDIAEYVGVSLDSVRQWEGGTALPDRDLWSKVEEAMGMPVPDPRVPDHTPAERELIDTMLLLIDELKLVGDRLGAIPSSPDIQPADAVESKLLDIKAAADYLGVSVSFVRNLVAQRTVVHYKIGGRLLFRSEDIDQLVARNKRELPDFTPWSMQGRRGKSPRVPSQKAKPVRASRPRPRQMSKEEIAEKRWTVDELGERWYGRDPAVALVERAGLVLTEDGDGQTVFRYGDLVSWVEGHEADFSQWVEEFDRVTRRSGVPSGGEEV